MYRLYISTLHCQFIEGNDVGCTLFHRKFLLHFWVAIVAMKCLTKNALELTPTFNFCAVVTLVASDSLMAWYGQPCTLSPIRGEPALQTEESFSVALNAVMLMWHWVSQPV
jgi:hypothetical protein